jgi:hypothetical protein
MSIARISTRAAVVGLGVLASLAFTAAPSWAGGGNSANAALCEEGGYSGVLLAQNASAFKNAGECTSYGAQGGQIAGVNAVVEPQQRGSIFAVTYSGFGLKPNSTAVLGVRYGSGPFEAAFRPPVGETGEFSFKVVFGCAGVNGRVAAVGLEATTKAGSRFLREFPPPPVTPPPNAC